MATRDDDGQGPLDNWSPSSPPHPRTRHTPRSADLHGRPATPSLPTRHHARRPSLFFASFRLCPRPLLCPHIECDGLADSKRPLHRRRAEARCAVVCRLSRFSKKYTSDVNIADSCELSLARRYRSPKTTFTMIALAHSFAVSVLSSFRCLGGTPVASVAGSRSIRRALAVSIHYVSLISLLS